MTAKSRVTLILAVNSTGLHKNPVAIIGKTEVPMCSKPPREACQLPCFSQSSVSMDDVLYKKWFNTVFARAVRARTRILCVLILDHCGAHAEFKHTQGYTFPLPHIVTSVVDLKYLSAGLGRNGKQRIRHPLCAVG